jgi:hypothetical protein
LDQLSVFEVAHLRQAFCPTGTGPVGAMRLGNFKALSWGLSGKPGNGIVSIGNKHRS